MIGVQMTDSTDFTRKAREVQIMFGVVHKLGFQAMVQHLTAHGGGISPLQFGMMRMLSMERMTLSELSRKFQLDPSTLVPSVDGLEQRRLIIRVKDPNDRRRQPLELTPEGDNLMRLVPMETDNDPLIVSMRAMGEEKVDQLLTLMRELINTTPDGEATMCDIQERLDAYQRLRDVKNV
jgi:DNA-binding MarR family transcriptional regulator